MPKKLTFIIKGTYYYDALTAYQQAKLIPLIPLKLEAEPTNLHDVSALRIYLDESILLGYVPRGLCPDLLVLMPTATALLTQVKVHGQFLELHCQVTAHFSPAQWLKLFIIKTYQTWRYRLNYRLKNKRLPS